MNRSESKYFNTAIKMDQALIRLLETKSFDYITVKEICETAGVNRSTFYLHYETIGDLLEETMYYLIDQFLSFFSAKMKNPGMSNKELPELNFITERYLFPYLTYIKENRRIFSAILPHGNVLAFVVFTANCTSIFFIPS